MSSQAYSGRAQEGGLFVSRALAGALALCLALLTALALTAPANAAVGTFQFGVVSGGPPPDEDVREMKELGVGTLRFPLNWGAIESKRRLAGASCDPGGLDGPKYTGWDRYDNLVAAAGAQDIELLPVFLGSPGYVGSRPTEPPASSSRREFKDFECFLRAVVKRYGYGGSLMNREPQADPIGQWQAWNEPNLEINAAKQYVNPGEYGNLVKLISNTVRARNPGATIVLAGMPERASGGVSSYDFLRRLYGVRGIRGKFDAVATHPYAANVLGVRAVLIRTRDVLREVGDEHRPLWVTETGYATAGQPGHFLVKTEEGQARELAKTLWMIYEKREDFRIGRVLWFNWRDGLPNATPPEHKRWVDYAGLYRWEGIVKPSCDVFRYFTGSQQPCQPLTTEGPRPEDSLFGAGGDKILPVLPEP